MIKLADLPYTLEEGMKISHTVPCFNGSFTYEYEIMGITQYSDDRNDLITLVNDHIPPMDVEPAWFLNRKVKFA